MANPVLDVVEVTAKTVISMIPNPIGNLLVNLFDKTKENALNKRQGEWQKDVDERLCTLEATVEELINSEVFVTALIKTTELAVKVGSGEKRKYLANALKNSFVYNFEEERFLILMDLVEKYTVSHFRVIEFFNNPDKFVPTRSELFKNSTPMAALRYHLSKYNYENEYLEKIVSDLKNDSVLDKFSTDAMMTYQGWLEKRTTKLGDDLLKLVMEDDQSEI